MPRALHPPGRGRCALIDRAIRQLVNYGLDTGLILPDDTVYITNQLLMTMGLDSYEEPPEDCPYTDLEQILRDLTDDAAARGVCEDNGTARDLFDTRLMGVLTPRPSIVRANFWDKYENEGPEAATDWFYGFCQDVDYIRRYRIRRDLKWVTKTAYGDLDITINLSKPEKDPKAIAAARLAPQSSYPKCQLCRENEGYAGRMNHPARENHRVIPVTINGSDWCFQYSPYVYYNEHCIVFNSCHTPMKIERATFRKLLDFVAQFPHYFVGSNADLPIVGGSILSHDHFQGGRYEFAMAKAPVERTWQFPGFADVTAGIVHWPMSCIRLSSPNDESLVALADRILTAWRGYTDADAFVFAETDGEPHNTITPIARRRGDAYELDLVLRNNITTAEHPLGVYHPHAKLHHIKKENIGLIEVMGLAVLPSRLKDEMAQLEPLLVRRAPAAEYPEALQKHAEWAGEILARRPELCAENVQQILEEEIGQVFAEVLADAGVYKETPEGRAAFLRFLSSVK
jgi:UDPglucose--hexose-1-phosphate uridylyltransferase